MHFVPSKRGRRSRREHSLNLALHTALTYRALVYPVYIFSHLNLCLSTATASSDRQTTWICIIRSHHLQIPQHISHVKTSYTIANKTTEISP